MYAKVIDDADSLDRIENLQNHENNVISEMAARLLASCWRQKYDDTIWLDPCLPFLEEDTLPLGIDLNLSDLPGDFDAG